MQTKIIKLNPDFPEELFIREAAMVLRKGGLVAFPTETVYGLGANFLDKKAIDRLYSIKNRPPDKPFTFHVADFETLNELEIELSGRAERLIRKFWPGPLTIVALNRKKQKIGLRMPRNKIALELIRRSGVPVVAPSANISGNKPPVSGEEVILELNGSIDAILDSGPTEIGIESTVLDVMSEPFVLLREGAISKEDLMADYHILFVCTGNSCRSVMAKAMLEKYLKGSGLSDKVWVDSAGTGAYSGIRAAPNTIEVMREEGTDVSGHTGKGITPGLLRKSDFIFIMEHLHRKIILNMLPEADSKVRLLREEGDISDPIGKSIEEYRVVRDIIKDRVENIFLELFEKVRHS
jgi:tRNA threonylcarbamoyl adenosine modification protein (Sua5/YciO/YrdC/YwlC family)